LLLSGACSKLWARVQPVKSNRGLTHIGRAARGRVYGRITIWQERVRARGIRMTTQSIGHSAVFNLWPRPFGELRRKIDVAAAIGCMGLLVAAAALPEKDRAPAAVQSTAEPTSTFAPGRESTFGAYLGAPYHYPSDFHWKKAGQHDLTIKDINWFTKPFDNPLYYGARIQKWAEGGRFGTMIDFTHSKAYAPFKEEKTFKGTLDGKTVPEKARVDQFFDKLEFSHGHNMLTLNGLMRFSSFGAFSPYAGIGAGISLPHSELHLLTDPARTYEYQYTGLNGQALFGIEFRTKTGAVFLEYKFTLADYTSPITHTDGNWLPLDMWRQFSRWWSGAEPPGGWASTRLTSHQVIGGFNVRFVPDAVAR
jgi:lipid A oxidase